MPRRRLVRLRIPVHEPPTADASSAFPSPMPSMRVLDMRGLDMCMSATGPHGLYAMCG